MLLQLENTDSAHLQQLIDYARRLGLTLSLIDEPGDSPALPGRPLSADQLAALIERNRASGTISMEAAHHILRQEPNADKL